MYKRITHTIVEEHFDQPVTWLYPQRYYSNGEVIPYKLPQTYVLSAVPEQSCETCGYRNSTNNYCSRWDAVVRPEYTCSEWKPIV